MARMTVLSGFSGAGKSTLADRLVNEQPCTVVLRSDTFHHCYQPAQDVTGFLIDLAYVHVRHGVNVIVDAVNKHSADKVRWQMAAVEAGCEMEWLDLSTPIEVCIARDAMRSSPVG